MFHLVMFPQVYLRLKQTFLRNGYLKNITMFILSVSLFPLPHWPINRAEQISHTMSAQSASDFQIKSTLVIADGALCTD